MTKNSDISLEIRGEREEIAVIRLTRPAKRNALNDGLILALRDVMDNLPASVGAAVIDGDQVFVVHACLLEWCPCGSTVLTLITAPQRHDTHQG